MTPLTPRQHEALLLVMRGKTYQEIALQRGVSPSTIRQLLHNAYARLDVTCAAQAAAMMLREGWVTPDEVLAPETAMPDYDGARYAVQSQRRKRDANWLPSPAQRLYLDAFDELLRERSDEAAEAVDFCFGVMCHVRRCPDRRTGRGDIDSMLLNMARGLLRVIPLAA